MTKAKEQEAKPMTVQMREVKFNSKMAPIIPEFRTGTLMELCTTFKCDSPEDLIKKISGCTIETEIEGVMVPKIQNMNEYLNIAIEILYTSTITAYELEDKIIDFTKKQVKNTIVFEQAQLLILWFVQSAGKILSISNSEGNEQRIIQIT